MTFQTTIKIEELDFELEFRPDDEDFNETYKKFCIHIIDNDDKTAESIKQQIIQDHIKAEKYDLLMQANNEIVQHNIDITKEHQIVERLKKEIDDIECSFDVGMGETLDLLKSILKNKK